MGAGAVGGCINSCLLRNYVNSKCVTSETTFSDGIVIFRHTKLIPCLNKTHLELVRDTSSLTE